MGFGGGDEGERWGLEGAAVFASALVGEDEKGEAN